MSAHLRVAWASRIAEATIRGAVPPEPGKSPLPSGTVRGFHYTDAKNLDAVRREGLLIKHARGHISQEPDAIWFSGTNSYWKGDPGSVLLEVAVPPKAIVIGGTSSNFAVMQDVPPSWIIAIHEAWHSHYRYLVENDPEGTRAGDHDSLLNDKAYGPAIRRIKSEGSKTAAKFSPSQVATWERTKPWSASREDLEYQNVPGIYIGQARGSEAASFQDGKIVLKEDYFRLDERGRRATLYHEAGHGLELAVGLSAMATYFGVDPLDVIHLPGAQRFGHNVGEVVAEGYAVLWTEPQWASFEGGQAVLDAVTKMARDKGYPVP